MDLQRKIDLTFEKQNVTKLSYDEMLYYMSHNVFIFVEVIFTIKFNKWKQYERGNIG